VDSHALAVLEYPAIAERLAAAASTPPGAALARALVPSPDEEEVARRQTLTAEAIALLDAAEEPSLHGIVDTREAAAHAARGGVLEPKALRDIATSVSVGVAARGALEAHQELAPLLNELMNPIDRSLTPLADAVGSAVEEDGSDLRDTASSQLRKLRGELREGKHRVTEELRRLARGSELREHLQENFVTERGGRPVLAVRASARGSVKGIVHDSSSSGQTLFVEPFAIVEANNRLSEAASAERAEVARILRELSEQAGSRADDLRALVEAAAALDLALASGLLSRRWRGSAVARSGEVRLLGARHPLLDAASAVPIDLDLDEVRALVISGPNAGGKTVALKTVGLAALLHQAGLRPPATEAALPVFDAVLADIGDEQSIEMSLSTFSGHVANLVAILEAATEQSLVLVDELASGTDPVEGSALAQALLARLVEQARLTVATTHYPEVKEWASATSGVLNAATGFDPETQAPLYRVALGRPGTSHALRIAERLGLDARVVADARARVAPERLRVAELLAEAEAAERQAAATRVAAEEERADAARSAERAREREVALESEVAAVRASAAGERQAARAEAEGELAVAHEELRGLRDEIRAARRRERERRRSTPGAERAERERDRRLGAASDRAARAEAVLRAFEEPLPLTVPLAAGDPVQAPDLGIRGTIAAIEGDEAEVVAPGGLRVRVPVARLRPDARREPEAPEPAVHVLAPTDVPTELDVRGQRAQEAREAVRAFVDDAALAGLSLVRVIHGRGTGAVRTAVREELNRHQLVERQESDSANGATVVHLGP
jgi:DNA mismatch repair protein MutS2